MTTSIKQLLGISNNNYIPQGGIDGQVLAKKSDSDFNVEWKVGSGSGGGNRQWYGTDGGSGVVIIRHRVSF
jgi:hypothetical protein